LLFCILFSLRVFASNQPGVLFIFSSTGSNSLMAATVFSCTIAMAISRTTFVVLKSLSLLAKSWSCARLLLSGQRQDQRSIKNASALIDLCTHYLIATLAKLVKMSRRAASLLGSDDSVDLHCPALLQFDRPLTCWVPMTASMFVAPH
jgi:hypothetical protein